MTFNTRTSYRTIPPPETESPVEGSTSDHIAIAVHNVSKMYPLYTKPSDRLKQSLWHALPQFLRGGAQRQFYRQFWALHDISLEVRRGESLGIIGRNGSGKSTLLQIIAGTLTPTTGEVQVRGRVTALLELGSGFNPEFTGRENVYLNGTILGLSHSEMDERFDEIAAFADIVDFIDQPVKLYSSGMLVRLAFAVQACLEPDVLIVDEALSVGDIFFRQKCHARIEKLVEQNTTVILVSHNMGDIQKYCQRAILFEKGKPLFIGSSTEAINRYYSLQKSPDSKLLSSSSRIDKDEYTELASNQNELSFWPHEDAFIDFSSAASIGEGWARCTAIALCDAAGEPCRVFRQGQRAYFYYEFEALRDLQVPIGAINISSNKNILVHGKTTLHHLAESFSEVPKGAFIRFQQSIVLNLIPGQYTFSVGLTTMLHADYTNVENMAWPEIEKKRFRLNFIDRAGAFFINPRVDKGLVFTHNGLCDLPGDCEIALIVP